MHAEFLERNTRLDIVRDEGKNRHIRRLLLAFGVEVLRLVRVAIGPLQLGALAKGQWRHLMREEAALLAPLASSLPARAPLPPAAAR